MNIGTGTTDATDDDVATEDLTGDDKGPGSTDVVPVDTGTYYFSEVSPGANYTTTFACEGTDADPTLVGGSDYVYSLAVAKGENAVCTFTNTRDQGEIQVVKDFVGAPTGAKVDLMIDGVVKKANAEDNGTTGFVTVNTGTHTVAENEVTGTDLADYSSKVECLDQNGASAGSVDPGTSLGNIQVDKGDQITCTITNTRNTGKIKIVKTVTASNFTESFGFTVTCTNPTATYTTTVAYPTPGYSTIDNIPTGSICTVAETSKPTPPGGYSWNTPVISPNPVTVTTKGETVTVNVTNSLTKTALTPGYWKTHLNVAFGLPGGSSVTLGNYPITTVPKAAEVFKAMNCSSNKPNDAIGCLAGHLLATECPDQRAMRASLPLWGRPTRSSVVRLSIR